VGFKSFDTTKIINALDLKGPFAEKGHVNRDIVMDLNEDYLAQVNWLKNQLKISKATWKIVFGHHPIEALTNRRDETSIMQRALLDTLCRYASLYISGHEHSLQLTKSSCSGDLIHKRPLYNILSGAASKMSKYTHLSRIPQRHLFVKGGIWGYVKVLFNSRSDNLNVKYYEVDQKGRVKLIHRHYISNRLR
jgi:hypothetical protein